MAHDDQCFRAVLVDGTVVSLAVHWSRRFGGTWTVEGAGYHEEPRLAAVTACRARGLALAELRGPGEATTAELLDLMKAAIAPEVEAALRASADLRAWREQAVEDAVPPPASGRLRSQRELVAWLAHAALEAGGLSEGEVARAMGLDRVEVRGVAIEGRDVGDRLRQERMARVRAELQPERSPESGPAGEPVRGNAG